jgi:hypothetical protein
MLRARRRFPNRKWFLIPIAGLVLALACASCSEPTPKPPPTPVTDTGPIGFGLSVIGYSMLGAACVLVLGKMIR